MTKHDFYPKATSLFLEEELTYDQVQSINDLTEYVWGAIEGIPEDDLCTVIDQAAEAMAEAYNMGAR